MEGVGRAIVVAVGEFSYAGLNIMLMRNERAGSQSTNNEALSNAKESQGFNLSESIGILHRFPTIQQPRHNIPDSQILGRPCRGHSS